MSDPLADLLGQIERGTFGTSMGPDTLKRWAAALGRHPAPGDPGAYTDLDVPAPGGRRT